MSFWRKENSLVRAAQALSGRIKIAIGVLVMTACTGLYIFYTTIPLCNYYHQLDKDLQHEQAVYEVLQKKIHGMSCANKKLRATVPRSSSLIPLVFGVECEHALVRDLLGQLERYGVVCSSVRHMCSKNSHLGRRHRFEFSLLGSFERLSCALALFSPTRGILFDALDIQRNDDGTVGMNVTASVLVTDEGYV